jgi:hypothetical protein
MLEIGLQLIAVAVVVGVVGVILQVALMPRYVFLVQINGGQLAITKGKVHADFLDDIREVVAEYGLTSGWIGGVKRGKNVALRFSRNIPPACQQRLRNLWFTS